MSDLLASLRKFTPERHGEQGVDASIHGVVEDSDKIHEVFCNPPGGSWTEFDIIHPTKDYISRWDHIPRRPPWVKRPDQVFQYNDQETLVLLTIESKYELNDLTSDIGERLIGYFEGHNDYTGLRHRPCWHQKTLDGKWKVVTEEASEEQRYWFRNHSDVNYLSGFMFANSPIDLQDRREIDESLEQTLSNSDVNVAISVSWSTENQYPLLYMKGDKQFKMSAISTVLQSALDAHNSNIETL